MTIVFRKKLQLSRKFVLETYQIQMVYLMVDYSSFSYHFRSKNCLIHSFSRTAWPSGPKNCPDHGRYSPPTACLHSCPCFNSLIEFITQQQLAPSSFGCSLSSGHYYSQNIATPYTPHGDFQGWHPPHYSGLQGSYW